MIKIQNNISEVSLALDKILNLYAQEDCESLGTLGHSNCTGSPIPHLT